MGPVADLPCGSLEVLLADHVVQGQVDEGDHDQLTGDPDGHAEPDVSPSGPKAEVAGDVARSLAPAGQHGHPEQAHPQPGLADGEGGEGDAVGTRDRQLDHCEHPGGDHPHEEPDHRIAQAPLRCAAIDGHSLSVGNGDAR